MRVFNLYMKVIKKNIASIMIFFTVFVAISVMMTFSDNENNDNTFKQGKTNIALYDYDDTTFTKNFRENIEKVANIIEIEDNSDILKDALFFRKVNAIIRIDEGFTKKLLNNESVSIYVNTIPNSYDSTYVELAINNYINTAKAYIGNTKIEETELINNINKNLANITKTELIQKEKSSDFKFTVVFFNYLSYALFSTIIIGVGVTMSTINAKNVKRRILCSPISNKKMSFEITLGHFVYSIVLLTICISLWLIMKPSVISNPSTWILILNSICLMLAILGISYFIGIFIRNKNAQNAAANVISLGTSFISGVFVPQAWLGDVVLRIASFTPTFWYIKANSLIEKINEINFENLKEVFICMLIQIGFAITFWLLAMVAIKNKRTEE